MDNTFGSFLSSNSQTPNFGFTQPQQTTQAWPNSQLGASQSNFSSQASFANPFGQPQQQQQPQQSFGFNSSSFQQQTPFAAQQQQPQQQVSFGMSQSFNSFQPQASMGFQDQQLQVSGDLDRFTPFTSEERDPTKGFMVTTTYQNIVANQRYAATSPEELRYDYLKTGKQIPPPQTYGATMGVQQSANSQFLQQQPQQPFGSSNGFMSQGITSFSSAPAQQQPFGTFGAPSDQFGFGSSGSSFGLSSQAFPSTNVFGSSSNTVQSQQSFGNSVFGQSTGTGLFGISTSQPSSSSSFALNPQSSFGFDSQSSSSFALNPQSSFSFNPQSSSSFGFNSQPTPSFGAPQAQTPSYSPMSFGQGSTTPAFPMPAASSSSFSSNSSFTTDFSNNSFGSAFAPQPQQQQQQQQQVTQFNQFPANPPQSNSFFQQPVSFSPSQTNSFSFQQQPSQAPSFVNLNVASVPQFSSLDEKVSANPYGTKEQQQLLAIVQRKQQVLSETKQSQEPKSLPSTIVQTVNYRPQPHFLLTRHAPQVPLGQRINLSYDIRNIELDVRDIQLSQEENDADSPQREEQTQESEASDVFNEEVPHNMLPHNSMPEEYITEPSIEQLRQMSDEQLRELSSFTIEHKQYGMITFDVSQQLDSQKLADVDVGKTVYFRQGEVYVYENEKKPSLGTKLNVPATITFYNVRPRNPKKLATFEQTLRNTLGDKFTSYNKESGTLHFHVKNFEEPQL